MKIAYCSDLHLDNYMHEPFGVGKELCKNKENADVILIGGDTQEYKIYDRVKYNFFEYLSNEYKHVIVIEGNHEFYQSDYCNYYELKTDHPFSHLENVHLLRDESIIIEDVLFYGGTMWTNLDGCSDIDKMIIKQCVSDFTLIKYDGKPFHPDYMLNHYNLFIDNLYNEVIYNNSVNKKIVLSHFAPSLKSVSPRFIGSNLNPFFCNNIDNIIESSDINFWIHGHTHDRLNYMIGNTNILCNPRGYPRENKIDQNYLQYITI